jgi:hypothetical protein
MKQEDLGFKASLGYRLLGLNKQIETTKHKKTHKFEQEELGFTNYQIILLSFHVKIWWLIIKHIYF